MRRVSTVQGSSRFAALTASAVLLLAATTTRQGAPGYTYSLRVTTSATDTNSIMGQTMASILSNWSATTIYAAGRGRTDITDGQVKGMWAKGDFVLFDSADFIIVHPATRTFFNFPKDFGKQVSGVFGANGMSQVFSDVSVRLDTLGDGELIEGYATRRYRLTSKFTLTHDMGGVGADAAPFARPPITMTTTNDLWVTDKVHLPTTAVMAAFSGSLNIMSNSMATMTGPLADIMAKGTAARAGIPTGTVTLKSVTSQQMSGSPVFTGESKTTMEITGIKAIDVDLGLLLLPEGFTPDVPAVFARSFGGSPMISDSGAKWRVKPPGA